MPAGADVLLRLAAVITHAAPNLEYICQVAVLRIGCEARILFALYRIAHVGIEAVSRAVW